jgi:hypothetical protein
MGMFQARKQRNKPLQKISRGLFYFGSKNKKYVNLAQASVYLQIADSDVINHSYDDNNKLQNLLEMLYLCLYIARFTSH